MEFGHEGSGIPAPGQPIEFLNPEDVEFDRSGGPTDGRIVVADADNHRVQIFDASGQFIYAIAPDALPGDDPGDFDVPVGVTVDNEGRIYVADLYNSRIQTFTPSGASSYAFEDAFGTRQTPGRDPSELQFLSPTGVAVSGGRLIITEYEGQRLHVLARSSLGIDTPTTNRTSVTLQDPTLDTVHVTVPVRNTGGLDLTSVSLSATASHLGTFASPMTPATDCSPACGPPTNAADVKSRPKSKPAPS